MSIEQWSDLMFPEQEGGDAHVYGSVKAVNADGSYEVQLNASSVTTRCAPCCTALVGDRVLVLIKANGKCDAIGRLGGDLGGGGSGEYEAIPSSQVDAIWASIPYANVFTRITDEQINSIYEEE